MTAAMADQIKASAGIRTARLAFAVLRRDSHPMAEAQEESDLQSLRAALAGNSDAARRLLRLYARPLQAFATRMLGDGVLAEDITQEVFLRLWRAGPSWRAGEGSLKAWLYRVALNLCRDRMRTRSTANLDEAADVMDDRIDLDGDMARAAMARKLRMAMTALPERQRIALTLCHFDDLPQQEAAAVMEISLDAYESLLARARRGLRAALQQDWSAFAEGEKS